MSRNPRPVPGNAPGEALSPLGSRWRWHWGRQPWRSLRTLRRTVTLDQIDGNRRDIGHAWDQGIRKGLGRDMSGVSRKVIGQNYPDARDKIDFALRADLIGSLPDNCLIAVDRLRKPISRQFKAIISLKKRVLGKTVRIRRRVSQQRPPIVTGAAMQCPGKKNVNNDGRLRQSWLSWIG